METTVTFGFTDEGLRLTDEQIAEAESGGGSKFMDQGVHNVKITSAGWHVGKTSNTTACKDPTWHNLKLVYVNSAGQTYNHYLQVPTQKLTFTTNTQKGPKESAYMFVKFRSFFAGIGELVTTDRKDLNKLVKKYLNKPGSLVGKELEITLGYKGCYLSYISGKGEEAEYAIMGKNGELLDAGPYTRKKAGIVAATKLKKPLSDLELLSIKSLLIDEDDESSVEKTGKDADEIFKEVSSEDLPDEEW
jgi:hypothetical protein